MSLPFEGLPPVWLGLFLLAFLLIAAILAWTAELFRLARGVRRRQEHASDGQTAGNLWVFLVPALDEEVTIRDSVERLLGVEVEDSRILVIDDGSTDGTAEILTAEAGAHPELTILTRHPPGARLGKAAALNAAYRALDPLIEEWARERVIVCVVDGDGRLDPRSPCRVAEHLADPRVGGVQLLVRIYNRGRLLAWLQDVEFSIFGFLYQAGRTAWGTAGMGGNGQFNRLSALDSVADAEGPWRDRLTEDQDLGLRLIAAGWAGRQELEATVDQQGLSNLRRLYRQRARWSQGNLQAMAHLGSLWRARLPFVTRLELAFHLLNPAFQGLIGVVLFSAIALALTGTASFWGDGDPWQLALFYLLGFGGVIFGCLARGARAGLPGLVRGFLLAQPYAIYTWILWPVLVQAAWRQLRHRRGWAKTPREALETADAGPLA